MRNLWTISMKSQKGAKRKQVILDIVNISKNRTESGMFTDSTEIRACIVMPFIQVLYKILR